MKNWGHDFLRAQGREPPAEGKESKEKMNEKANVGTEDKHEKKEDESSRKKLPDGDKSDTKEEHAGTKRKSSHHDEEPSKKRETEKTGEDDKPQDLGLAKGDTVSWSWGGGHPTGKVLEVKEKK